MCQSKKGMSALQIHRTIGSGSYRTACYICHRIRAAIQNDDHASKGFRLRNKYLPHTAERLTMGPAASVESRACSKS